jgi:hypothetical protein
VQLESFRRTEAFDRNGPEGASIHNQVLKFYVTTRSGGSAVFWTIFTVAIVLWMVALAAAFGPGVAPLLLVLGAILAAMNFAFRRRSLN